MEWCSTIQAAFARARFDEPMTEHTTFRIGGPADCYLELERREELVPLFSLVKKHQIPLFMLGWGSNLLVRDGGLRALVLRLRGEFEEVSFPGGALVRAGCGVRVPQLAALCAERSLSGAEPLVGVPGTVGGALVMNAGTRDGEIGPLVREIEIFDRETLREERLAGSEAGFAYRRSALENRVILGCLLELKPGVKGDIIQRIQQHQKKRLQTQPIHSFNVGSIFKNPPGRFVAKLIEEAGLKGSRHGGARVSPLHANFIENVSGATASDVLGLIESVRARVRAASGLELELEVKVVGEA